MTNFHYHAPDGASPQVLASDALKYAAARARYTTDWALDSIAGSTCDHDGHEVELDAVSEAIAEIQQLATAFGDPNRYSDGRAVRSSREIQLGLVMSHVWHPDPTQESVHSWRGDLPSGDPDLPSPGVYEITTHPETQEIHVRTVRLAG
ncbi:hypothetical protein A5647_14295 [Mycobacterium sp. 1100029.7]|nr:hypothetical protein A5647_14295 [Mycobacterium sp. 1100029.7]